MLPNIPAAATFNSTPPPHQSPSKSVSEADATHQAQVSRSPPADGPRLHLPRVGTFSRLVVGDSNLAMVDKHRFDSSGNTHVITLRGTTTARLSASMDNTEPRQDVNHVVFQVGTNDLTIQISANNNMIDSFSKLIDSARRIFPRARIGISSILPRRGIPLTTVLRLNRSLETMCNKRNVALIGDQSMFLAKTDSFPRHLFKSDKIHLNQKGVGVLLAAIKRHLLPDTSRKPQRPDHPPPRLADLPPREQQESQNGRSRPPRPPRVKDQSPSLPRAATHQQPRDGERDRPSPYPTATAVQGRTPPPFPLPSSTGAAVPQGHTQTAPNTPFPHPLLMPSAMTSPPFGYPNPMFLFNPANGQYHAMGLPPFIYRH